MENEGKKYDIISKDFAELRDTYTEKKYLDFLMLRIPQDAHILDVGCGSGKPIASYLIKHHYQVTGLDASEKLIKIAKEKHPTMSFLHGDMRSIDIKSEYDAVIAWDSFFHLPQKDQPEMIERFASWIKEKGLLVFTTGDKEGEILNANMLGEQFSYYSLDPTDYASLL